MKNGMTASPRTCALKPFSLELKDSVEALVDLF